MLNDSSGWEMECRHCSRGEDGKVHLSKGEEDLGSSCSASAVAPVVSRVPLALQPSVTPCNRNQDGLSTQI